MGCATSIFLTIFAILTSDSESLEKEQKIRLKISSELALKCRLVKKLNLSGEFLVLDPGFGKLDKKEIDKKSAPNSHLNAIW